MQLPTGLPSSACSSHSIFRSRPASTMPASLSVARTRTASGTSTPGSASFSITLVCMSPGAGYGQRRSASKASCGDPARTKSHVMGRPGCVHSQWARKTSSARWSTEDLPPGAGNGLRQRMPAFPEHCLERFEVKRGPRWKLQARIGHAGLHPGNWTPVCSLSTPLAWTRQLTVRYRPASMMISMISSSLRTPSIIVS